MSRRLAALLLWLCMGSALAAAIPDPLAPTVAELLVSEAPMPATDDSGWQQVTLPDSWRLQGRKPPQQGAAWYRITFEAPADEAARHGWAVYLPYLYDGGTLFLNGERLGSIPEPDAQTHVKWERPHLLPVPDPLLRPGRNVLLLRTVDAQAITNDLSVTQPLLGPIEAVLPLYERRLHWTHTAAELTSSICFLGAALMLFIWWRRRTELLYGLFGVTLLMWGVRTMTFSIEILPAAQWAWWRSIYQAATGGFVVSLALFAMRYGGCRRRAVEWVLTAYGLLGPVLMLLSGGRADGWLSTWWFGGFVLIAIGILVVVALTVWQRRSLAATLLMASVALTVLAAIHDYMVLMSARGFAALWPEWAGARIYVLHLAANLLLAVMGGLMASRFVNTLSELERLNRTLEDRVAEREALLRHNYAQLSALERERATAEERQRIMQDIHDGLGSRLFTTLSRTEREVLSQYEISQTLRDCIAEMRLAIEALTPGHDDMPTALGDFRFRWEAQLLTAGVRSSWQLDLPADTPALPPHGTLQLLRILQEALTNVLKHAQAHHVLVRLAVRDGWLDAEVRDDGVGPPEAVRAGGRGLRNMRSRAARLGAELLISAAPGGGTRVMLRWSPWPQGATTGPGPLWSPSQSSTMAADP